MSAGPPRSPRWKRRIRWIPVLLVAVPPALLLLGNLLLATPWARGKVARMISARTGVEAVVGRLSCTPWGGFVVRDLRLRQPPGLQDAVEDPVLEVRRIEVVPRWRPLLKGKLEFSEIRIEQPRAVVAVEMLASMASRVAAEPAAASPPVALAVPVPAPSGGGESAAAPLPVPPPAPAAVPAPTVVVAGETEEPETAWVVIEDAGLQFRSASMKGSLGEVSGMDARIPVAGRAATSSVTLGRIDILGRNLASGLSLPLAWKAPELRLGPCDLRVAGLQVKLAAVAGRMPGAPFAVELTVPPQAFDGSPFFPQLRPVAEQVEARVQGIGLLRVPSSWQGMAQAVARRPVLATAGEMRRFDEARALAVLQGGVLHCPDVRLTGERLSLLGNGRIGGGGQGSAVLRMVVPPDDAAAISRRFAVPGGAAGPVFRPLGTPERVFLDLRWISYSGGQGVELGEGGPVVPVGEIGRLVSPEAN